MSSLRELPDFLTIDETAAIVRLSRSQTYSLCRLWRSSGGKEGLQVVEIGHRLRVPKTALLRLAGWEQGDGDAA